jgi:hypothetical protein
MAWTIAGWVVWGLCAALSAVWVLTWYGYLRAGREYAFPLGVQAGLWLTLVVAFLVQPWSKFHLLWCFPIAYFAGLFIPMVIMGLRISRVGSQFERHIAQSREEHRDESFRAKSAARTSFPIGEYILDASIDGLTGLVEFSPTEYATMGREFEGETHYNAPPVTFLGRPWKMMLGTVHGRVYKIAPYLELATKQEANPIAVEVLRHCTGELGRPSSQKTGLFIWDTTDGNVILQTAETSAGLAINLFVTSHAVRGFRQMG